jgi:uncharacterized lipoprotein YajG
MIRILPLTALAFLAGCTGQQQTVAVTDACKALTALELADPALATHNPALFKELTTACAALTAAP